jgi:outer membrane lipoprotein-sorting protein
MTSRTYDLVQMTKIARASRGGFLLCALALIAAPAPAAPTAQDILKKAEATMNGARTYQAAFRTNVSMGQMGSISMNMRIRAIPNKKMSMTTTPNGQPTGMMAMGAANANMTVVDDGKTFWVYMPAMKMYSKRPSQIAQKKTTDVTGINQFAKVGDVKLLRTENIGGRPAYVIQVIPKAGMLPGAKQTILIYIDRATNRFKQMKMDIQMPAGTGPNGQPTPPQTMNTTVVVMNETLNAPIPDSVFKFTPPPGVKEMKGGMTGGSGMGMPGGMGGGPRRR